MAAPDLGQKKYSYGQIFIGLHPTIAYLASAAYTIMQNCL